MYGLATTYVPRRRRDAINRSQSAPHLHRGGKTPRDVITPHDHRSQPSTVTYGSISTTYIGLPPRIDHVEGRKHSVSGSGMRRVASAASWIPHRDEDEIHDRSAILASLTTSQVIETSTLLPPTQIKNISNDTVPIALTCLASCGALLFGIHIGYSSPFEDDVRAASSMSQVETDFMFSLISIGAVMGSFLAGPLSNELGRRMAIVMTSIPYIFGALMMTFLPSLLYLSIGRLLCGVGVGLSSVLTPLYIAEISPPHLRGGLGAANQFFLTLGLVLINALGIPGITNKSWWSIIMLSTLIPVCVMACGMLMVGLETPGWLLAHQKSEDALSVLRRLRGPHWDCRGELLEMSDYEEVGAGVVTDIPTIYSVDGEEDEEIDDVSDSESMSSRSPGAPSPALKGGLHSPVLQHGEGQVQVAISSTPPPPLVFAPSPCTSPPPQVSAWRLFFLPRAFIPFMIGVVLQLMQQWSGINAFMFHTKALLGGNSADGSTTPADAYTALYGAIAVNGIQVIMTGAAMLLMDRAGRRTWLISSCIGLSVISYLMGYAYYAGASNVVKILLVMLYVTFFAIGLGPLPWLMCGELFHSSVRSTAMSIATVVNWTSAFLVTATFGMFESLVTTSGVFWCYGTVALLGATFVYFIVPETRGKSLDEIETLFEKRGEHDEMDTADDETWPQAIIQQREGEAYVME